MWWLHPYDAYFYSVGNLVEKFGFVRDFHYSLSVVFRKSGDYFHGLIWLKKMVK